jgi:HEAT repeat protein
VGPWIARREASWAAFEAAEYRGLPLNDRIVEELTKRQDAIALGALLDKADDLGRLPIAKALGKVPGEAPVPFLIQLLKPPYRGIRWAAIDGLARPEAKAAVPALLQVLGEDRKSTRLNSSH